MENIKLVILDVDGTLLKNNSWYELNMALGITPEEDKQMYDDYFAGKLTYDDWIEKLVGLYQARGKATKDNIEKVQQEQVVVSEEVKDLVQYLKAKGYELVVLSGSFDIVTKKIADELGIEDYKGNSCFVFDESGTVTAIENDGEEKYAKVEHLKFFAEKFGVGLEQCACVGDGGNDIEIFKITKRGITFSSSGEEIKQAAWKVVDSLGDIKEIL